MADDNITDSMLDMFLYETEMMLEQLETATLACQSKRMFDEDCVNEVFRIMHTIKGSSGIMMYNDITKISHKLEDIFYYIRENHLTELPYEDLIQHTLDVGDYIRGEIEKIKEGQQPDGDPAEIIARLDVFLTELKQPAGAESVQAAVTTPVEAAPTAKQAGSAVAAVEQSDSEQEDAATEFRYAPDTKDSKYYLVQVMYHESTEMSNVRAYSIIFNLRKSVESLFYSPKEILTEPKTGELILQDGFWILTQTAMDSDLLMHMIDTSSGIEHIEFKECSREQFMQMTRDGILNPHLTEQTEETSSKEKTAGAQQTRAAAPAETKTAVASQAKQSFISVNVNKLDQLMDLIGELVIAEAVVLQDPALNDKNLDLTNFRKNAAQLAKNTSELQDVIMSIRMMPLTNTFQKMNRIVFDTSRKLGKEIELQIIGEGTEVDKNIIEHISDPLMHMIRNAVDHGIEAPAERLEKGKPEKGVIVLEAKNEGGKVWITVKDDGKGLCREQIIKKARTQGLYDENKEYTDKEIFNFITLPGFSTNEVVTEYSGRGVGMDVVMKNIQGIGGTLDIDSKEDGGTTITMKIPLTLAIIDGILFRVGDNTYVVPTGEVKEFVSITSEQLIQQPDGTESILLRDECYPLLRLKSYYNLSSGFDQIEDGITAILEYEERRFALFIDDLIGEQEIVVKPIPSYIKKVKGLSGCTQLGDGSISLILDTSSMIQ